MTAPTGDTRLPGVTWARMRTFAAVADTGSVRAAAAQLHVTEPAVSAAIGQVQRHLGVDLVRTHGRGIRLTPAGQTYAQYCHTLLGLAEEAELAVHAAATRLRVGAVATAAETILPRLLADFSAVHPDVELSLTVLPRDDLFTRLVRHQCDVAITGRPMPDSGLLSVALRPNRLVVVSSPGYDHDPATATWLLRGPGSGTRQTCLSLLQQHEWSPPTLTLGTHGAVLAAAEEGLGLTLIHTDSVTRSVQAGALRVVPVPGTPLDRPWHLLTHASPPPAVQLFIERACGDQLPEGSRFHPHNRPRG